MKNIDLKALLKRVFELIMPDLRAYYRITRKAKVVKAYASDGQYWADVQPLRNDESEDPDEPVISKVEIPILWGGPERGVVCPPETGTLCDLEYYDGDPNCPRISNFRWKNNKAPSVGVGEFIIQQAPGIAIKIDKDGIVTIDAVEILLNRGMPVVTTGHICHYTGTPHGDGSLTVKAEV